MRVEYSRSEERSNEKWKEEKCEEKSDEKWKENIR